MKISLNWLNDYIDLQGIPVEEISHAITFLGMEVEGVENTGVPHLENVFVGEVLTRDRHPNADKLSVCSVDVGAQGKKRIVCGAQNYKVGDRVPVALPGAVLPGDFVIKQSAIRGESSDGMMCSARELGMGDDHSGLLILASRPELGTPINEVLPKGDTVFDLEITPNRPDCLSHIGVARELSAYFKKDLRYPEVRFTPAAVSEEPRPDLLKDVRVEAPEACPLYTATVVSGVKIGPSPEWMQQRLLSVGLRPINNAVDIGNYVMLEYGQPVHAFDAKRLGGAEIIVRPARQGETLLTLDGKERVLDERMLVIADAKEPVVVAGIMGGENSGVADDTTDLVLEVAVFERKGVRATSKRLALSSDSSYRYERGVDVHTLEEAMHRFIDLILEHTGGKVAGHTFSVGGDIPWEREVTLTPDFVNERIGFEIPDERMKEILNSLEFTITREEEAGPEWTVSIPSWRGDVDRPIDLVEEILRVYGTDKIPDYELWSPGLIGNDDPIVRFNRRVSDILSGQSFCECVNYTLRSKKEVEPWAAAGLIDELALDNPLVEDQSHLRPTLISGLLEALKLNQSRGESAPRLFETGRVFLKCRGKVCECLAVGLILGEDSEERSWKKREDADFYTTKRLVSTLAEAAGIDFARQPISLVPSPSLGWQEGQAAVVGNIDHGWMAQMGLIDLALLKKLGVEGRVYGGLFVILPEKLGKDAKRARYQPFSLQPRALRDLALIVDEKIPAADVQKSLAKIARASTGKEFGLEAISLFDVYQGKGLPEGTKSLAFSLSFRAENRTLTDAEVNLAFAKIQEEIEKSYQIRK